MDTLFLPLLDDLRNLYYVSFFDIDPDDETGKPINETFICYTNTEDKAKCISELMEANDPQFPNRFYTYSKLI